MISGRRAQELQRMRAIKLRQLPSRDLDDLGKSLALARFKQSLRVGTAEAIDHPFMLERVARLGKVS